MITYTKRQYLAEVAANEAATAVVRATLESFPDRLAAGETIDALGAEWNAAHDREWELEQERFDIERRWTRRSWTGADYSAYELVAANID